MDTHMKRRLSLATAAATAVLLANAPSAQPVLEEVVVTAQKREQNMQDVPVAVTALSAGQIERGIINSVVDLKKLAPNVELIAQPFAGAALSASIRGVGLDDLEKTFEPTVGVSIDGVFLASTAGANVDLFDIESVEVLRGPQGTLYGRNWGGAGHVKFLHFEACYYQAIDYAIRHGLKRVEAGAQGEHKIQRGYLPSPTYSAHWIRDPALRDAVAHFLARERRAIDHEQNILESFAPFRKDGETGPAA